MNMIVKSAKVECRGPLSRTGNQQPLIRAFMDDFYSDDNICSYVLMAPTVAWTAHLMGKNDFKPTRSLILNKGREADHFRFALEGTQIPLKKLSRVWARTLIAP